MVVEKPAAWAPENPVTSQAQKIAPGNLGDEFPIPCWQDVVREYPLDFVRSPHLGLYMPLHPCSDYLPDVVWLLALLFCFRSSGVKAPGNASTMVVNLARGGGRCKATVEILLD